MTATPSAAQREWTVDKSAQSIAVTCAVAVTVFFASGLLNGGFHMDYQTRYNMMLVWSAIAGGIGVSACHAWLAYNRDIGGIRDIPWAAEAVWTLAYGAVLWLFAALTDMSRINTSGFEQNTPVARIPVEWGMWVPLLIAASLSLLYAHRRGMLRWATILLPLQALWWSATLLTASTI